MLPAEDIDRKRANTLTLKRNLLVFSRQVSHTDYEVYLDFSHFIGMWRYILPS